MTQAPTPGPLMVGDYAVRLEDHPLVKSGEVHRVTEMFRGGYLGFARPVGGEWNPSGWRKCDADGWMPWSGGENPVRGYTGRVEIRLRSGDEFTGSDLEDDNVWSHVWGGGDIIAFRLAPTAPVEASGSERGIVLDWRKVETTALEEWRAEFGDYAAIVTLGHDNVWSYRVNNSGHLGFASADEAKQQALTALTKRLTARLVAARETVALYDALRPQPSGETREALDRLKMAAHVYEDDEMAADCATLEALLSARPAPVASGGQHSSANDFPPGEVTDEWAERFCEAVNWSPDGQECKAVEGQVRCVSFRDLAKGYILSAIATQPAITSATAPVAETAGEAHEARAIRLQAALDAAIAADDGLARAAAAEAQLDRLVDYLAGHLNGLRVGRKEAVDTVIVNLTKLIEAQATTPPVPAQDDDKLREEETEVQYEVWGAGPQGDFCAGADTLSDAQHYAVVYGQDGPVVIKVATTTRVVWAEASPALKSTAAQEGGE